MPFVEESQFAKSGSQGIKFIFGNGEDGIIRPESDHGTGSVGLSGFFTAYSGLPMLYS